MISTKFAYKYFAIVLFSEPGYLGSELEYFVVPDIETKAICEEVKKLANIKLWNKGYYVHTGHCVKDTSLVKQDGHL